MQKLELFIGSSFCMPFCAKGEAQKRRPSGKDSMLQIQNLTIRHLGDDKNLLENFNCVVNKGDKAVIIGEEGNGKSTLLKWIYDPALIEPYAHATGRLVSRNETTGQAEKLGYLPQELRTRSFRFMTIFRRSLCFGRRARAISGALRGDSG